MRQAGLILLVTVAVLVTVPVASAQNGSAVSCSSSDEATSWWLDQEQAVTDRGLPELTSFWDAILPQLQTQAISDPQPLCGFLNHVLQAGTDEPVEARSQVISAAEVADGLPDGKESQAQAVLYAVGEEIGRALEAQAKATSGPGALEYTPDRIDFLEEIRALYKAVGLDGARARIDLWLEAEQETWDRDTERVDRHLQEAETAIDLADEAGYSAFALGSIPRIQESLRTDARIMESHGAQDRVDTIETTQAELGKHQSTALRQTLATTAVLSAGASAVFLAIRVPLSWFERDRDEVEAMMKGVPT